MNNKQNPKRRNHEVPRGLLKAWLGTLPRGINYFDLQNNCRRFENGDAAKFAITEWLYVPEIDGERDDGLENWFSIDENGLAVLSQAAEAGSAQGLGSKHLTQAVRAAIALGLRSSYQLLHLSVAEAMTRGSADLHAATLRRQESAIRAKFKQFANWNFCVLYNLPGDLLVNEQPFRDWTLRGPEFQFCTMSLGPRSLLMGFPSDRADPRAVGYSCVDAHSRHKIVGMHNHAMIQTARQWVVARSAKQLDDISPELTPEDVSGRKELDRLIILGPYGNGHP